MTVKRVTPAEARELMDKEGYAYLDVRSIPEFDAGHPEGAYNVPLLHLGPAGMAPNSEFLAVVESRFPRDAKLVVGCKMGGRSRQAVSVLTSAGYSNLADQYCGFDGAPSPAGFEPGWRPSGLPVNTQAPADHTYEGLRKAQG
jgi:rhodanese-related sulfurtransferase